jgi:hypothetical protein
MVEPGELISKKDLLMATGISYGQLYRWKRKGLIPEDWFVRKSTFTGQETFFPKERMLARVEKILSMKTEDASLDDIADAVSTAPLPETVGAGDAVARGILSARALELYAEIHGPADPLRFQELTAAYVLDRLLGSGDVGVEEARAAVGVFEEGYGSFEGRPCDLVIARKMGVAVCLLVAGSAQMVVESGARVVARLGVSESIEQLKSKLR